jgi:hypothetical protein
MIDIRSLLIKNVCLKAAYLNYFVQGGQLYKAFPFSKGSLLKQCIKNDPSETELFKSIFLCNQRVQCHPVE